MSTKKGSLNEDKLHCFWYQYTQLVYIYSFRIFFPAVPDPITIQTSGTIEKAIATEQRKKCLKEKSFHS